LELHDQSVKTTTKKPSLTCTTERESSGSGHFGTVLSFLSCCVLQALSESSRRLQDCAGERARVLELLPHSGSAGGHDSVAQTVIKTDPISPFTPGTLRIISNHVGETTQAAQE